MTPALALVFFWSAIVIAAACIAGHVSGLHLNLLDAEAAAEGRSNFNRNVRAASDLRLAGFVRRDAGIINWDQKT